MDDEQYQRVLSIDFGLKRIGLALSDPLKTFAYPYKTIENNNLLLKNISDIIKEKNVSTIILGNPSDEKTSKTSIVKEIQKFKLSLQKMISIPIIEWDESFTSIIAQDKILESVNRKSKRKEKGMIDRFSASVILQEYLDSL